MVRLDVKGVFQRKNVKGEDRFKHYISFNSSLCEKFNIDYYKPHETPVEVLTVTEFENLQKKKSDEKAVAILNKTIENQKEKINVSDSIIEDKDNKISGLTTQIETKTNEIIELKETIKILKNSSKEINEIEREVSRLTKENTELISKERRLGKKNKKLRDRLQKQTNENIKLSLEIKTIEKNHDNILQNTQNQYQEIYNQLNKEKVQLEEVKDKCTKFNASLITEFKNILDYGIIDLITNRYKKTIQRALKNEIIDDNKRYKAIPDEK